MEQVSNTIFETNTTKFRQSYIKPSGNMSSTKK